MFQTTLRIRGHMALPALQAETTLAAIFFLFSETGECKSTGTGRTVLSVMRF